MNTRSARPILSLSTLSGVTGILLFLSCTKLDTIPKPSPHPASTSALNTAKPFSMSNPLGALKVITLAGDGTTTVLSSPAAVAVDATGNVYVADAANNRIRKITTFGFSFILAGTGVPGYKDGSGSSAQFNNPTGIAVDRSGNVFVADRNNNRIRKITPDGNVSLLAGTGAAGFTDGGDSSAQFSSPAGIAVDTSGNLYVTDVVNERIRKITTTGLVGTLAGNGNTGSDNGPGGFAATFNHPIGIVADRSGNVYVADSGNNQIRRITPDRNVSLLTGDPDANPGNIDGAPNVASFNSPTGITIDASGTLYVADKGNNRVRQVTLAGTVSAWAGNGAPSFSDGPAASAAFKQPTGITTDAAGILYVADAGNNRIREIGTITFVNTLAGSTAGLAEGAGANARFQFPSGVALDASGNIYIADMYNSRIRKMTPSGVVSTLAGASTGLFDGGYRDGPGNTALFLAPSGVAVDAAGNVYVADLNNNRIRKITPAGFVSTLAGSGAATFADGTGTAASFNWPSGVAVDPVSGNIYVADRSNFRIRRITPGGVVTTLAGNSVSGSANGNGAAASFGLPNGIAVDGSGNIYVADEYNHNIRKISPAGDVITLAGSGTAGYADGTGASAMFNYPQAVTVDASGNVYVADGGNRIRKVTQGGVVTTVAGNGVSGFADGPGNNAEFYAPQGLVINAAGIIYVADVANNRIRTIQ